MESESNLFEFQISPEAKVFRAEVPNPLPTPVFRENSVVFSVRKETYCLSLSEPSSVGVNGQFTAKIGNTPIPSMIPEAIVSLFRLEKSLLPINENMILLPFEAFYIVEAMLSRKTRVLPILRVFPHRTTVSLHFEMYLGLRDTVEELLTINEGVPTKESQCFLTPRFNFPDRYFRFIRIAKFSEFSADAFKEFKIENFDANSRFVLVQSLETKEEIVFNSKDLMPFFASNQSDFKLEKMYLASKASQILSESLVAKHFKIKLTPRMILLPLEKQMGDWISVLRYESAAVEGFGDFPFFCYSSDIDGAKKALEAVVKEIEKATRSKPKPRCYFVEKRTENSLTQAIKDKSKPSDKFLFFLINAFCDDRDQVFKIAKEIGKKAVFIAPEGDHKSSKIFLEDKIYRLVRKSTFSVQFSIPGPSVQLIFAKNIKSSATHISFKIHSLSFQGRTSTFSEEYAEIGSDSSLMSYFENLSNGKKQYLFWPKTKSDLISASDKTSVIYYRSNGIQLFPNIRKSAGFNDLRVNLQTYQGFIHHETFKPDKFTEDLYDRWFIPLKSDRRLDLLSEGGSWELAWPVGDVSIDDLIVGLLMLHIWMGRFDLLFEKMK